MARPTKLTAEIHQRIVQFVRAGAFETVAARAGGVHPSTLRRWKKRGEREPGLYRDFVEDLEQTKAEVRAVAEHRVYEENPLGWLRLGPGRARTGEEGWTEQVALTGPEGGVIALEVLDELVRQADRSA